MAEYLVNFLNVFTGLRKTIVMLALLSVSIIFRINGLITPDNFEGLMKATVIAYFGSNACEHYTAMIKERLLANGKKEDVAEINTKTEEG
jgi:hypothetical protein